MAAYYDSPDWIRHSIHSDKPGPSGHLIADTRAELEAFAARLNLHPKLYLSQALVPHYQLPVEFHEAAAALGAIYLPRKRFTVKAGQVAEAILAAERPARMRETPRPASPPLRQPGLF